MNSFSRSYYKKFYRLVVVAVAVMTAVITGSLTLGDSVRGSLMERVNERLGNAETLIQTGMGFLDDSILDNHLLSHSRGYLLTEGFVFSNGQMIPVTVWGTDEDSLRQGEALTNQWSSENNQTLLILHLPSNNLVGSGSLFVSQSYTTQLRLAVKGVKSGQDGGNILLHNEQLRPINIFMNRQELAEALGIEGKVNVILSPERITPEAFRNIWRPEDSGLQRQKGQWKDDDSHYFIGSDRAFMSQGVVDSLKPYARFLAYFVNSLGDIPYSFVTATDQLHNDETILTDYAAKRLNAHLGDSVTMEYYVSHGGLKRLETRSHRFCVSRIIPISDFQQQAELITANFPGLSGVKRCTDWDSDLPIDMTRISQTDEDYWAEYRQTPKALVSLDAVGHDWIGSYGVATKVIAAQERWNSLSPESFGIVVIQPRETALRAAQNGTDFGMLFLSLGFFIIIAAILLMQNPLLELYQLRRSEIQFLDTLGFNKHRIFSRLFFEALPVVLIAMPIGIFLGYAYAAVILWLLGGPWSGATHTDGFALHTNPMTIIVACCISMLVAVAVLCLTVKTVFTQPRQKRTSPQTASLLRASLYYYRRQHRLSFWTLALGVLAVFAVGLNRPDFSHSSETATGGYRFFGESRIPIQYDLNTSAGRHHLHLDNLPANTSFLQLPKHTEDEASCLNLNKVETPSVVGMSLGDMKAFGIDTTQFSTLSIAIDEEALLWSMMKQVGDTLVYHASDGHTVKAVIAASYPTGIFHGNAIMPIEDFHRLWPNEMGSRIILGNSSEITISLADYGLAVTTTAERLQMFFEVTDTYLRIFLSLGGLGLLLGLASLLIVIRKNLTARRNEIQLYHTLGFPTEMTVDILRREQMVVPILAIIAGVLGSLLVSLLLPTFSLLKSYITPFILLLLMLLTTWIVIHISITPKNIKQCETY